MCTISGTIAEGVKCEYVEYRKAKEREPIRRNFEVIIVEKFPKSTPDTKIEIQKTQATPSMTMINVYSVFQLQKTEGKEKVRGSWRKRFYYLKKQGYALQQTSYQQLCKKQEWGGKYLPTWNFISSKIILQIK